MGISKRIFASFLFNHFLLYLELKILNFKRVAKNFQLNLILPKYNFDTFLFYKNILELSFAYFQS